MAAAHTLHYQIGTPVRKVPAVLETLTGLKLTQGAITQDALHRAGGKVGAAYQSLRAKVRDPPAVYVEALYTLSSAPRRPSWLLAKSPRTGRF
jgi:transposase